MKGRRSNVTEVDEILAQWKETNSRLDSSSKPVRRVHAVGSKKGCMKGKGGPENLQCKYRGVRQRVWGKWVAEIRQPNSGKKIWLGSFPTAIAAALKYDEAAKAMYGSSARLNLPDHSSSTAVSSTSDSTITTSSNLSGECSTTAGTQVVNNGCCNPEESLATRQEAHVQAGNVDAGLMMQQNDMPVMGINSMEVYLQQFDVDDCWMDLDEILRIIGAQG